MHIRLAALSVLSKEPQAIRPPQYLSKQFIFPLTTQSKFSCSCLKPILITSLKSAVSYHSYHKDGLAKPVNVIVNDDLSTPRSEVSVAFSYLILPLRCNLLSFRCCVLLVLSFRFCMFHSYKPRSYKGIKSTAYLLQSNTVKNRSPFRAQGAWCVNVVCAILYPSLVLNDFMQNIYQKNSSGKNM